MSKKGGMFIEYVPLGQLQKAPRNPKQHASDELGQSIDRFGYVQPVLINEATGEMVAGHGRLERLQQLKAEGKEPPDRIQVDKAGEWLVPVIRGVSFKSPQEAEAYLVADNRLVEMGGWDDKMLAEVLADLRSQSVSFEGIGWSEAELDRMVADVTQESQQEVTHDADTFLEGSIKQLVLYFPGPEFDSLISRLNAVMAATGSESHSEAFKKLLEHYEASNAGAANPAS